MVVRPVLFFFFFFNDTATTEIYTLSLHDALPIFVEASLQLHHRGDFFLRGSRNQGRNNERVLVGTVERRSEEHTSELQSRLHLVCRLLLEKKKAIRMTLHQS